MMVNSIKLFLTKAEQGKGTLLRWEDNIFGIKVKMKETKTAL